MIVHWSAPTVSRYCSELTTPHARLQNRLFENYDVTAFNSAFPAKVQGTYNLHDHLPSGMDFFVILGYIAAFIGPAPKSNYAGAPPASTASRSSSAPSRASGTSRSASRRRAAWT